MTEAGFDGLIIGDDAVKSRDGGVRGPVGDEGAAALGVF
jgi:hypothetical protein